MEESLDKIKEALLLLTSSHNVKPTKSLLAAWTIAIDLLTPEQIDEATVYCMRVRDSPYMPTTAEFISIAQEIDERKAKERRIAEEIAEANRYIEGNPVDKKKIKDIVAELAKALSNKKMEPADKPSIVIYEVLDKNGRLRHYKSFGRIDAETFRGQVKKAYKSHVSRVIHQHERFELVKPDDDKTSPYSSFVRIDQPTTDSTEFTIGFP